MPCLSALEGTHLLGSKVTFALQDDVMATLRAKHPFLIQESLQSTCLS